MLGLLALKNATGSLICHVCDVLSMFVCLFVFEQKHVNNRDQELVVIAFDFFSKHIDMTSKQNCPSLLEAYECCIKSEFCKIASAEDVIFLSKDRILQREMQ